MFCTRCGANNLDTDQFCRSCNAPLVRPGGAQGQSAPPGSGQQSYPYSTSGSGQQQQPPQSYSPYPGYQGHPPAQYGYANQMSGQQGNASGRATAAMIVSAASLALCFLTCCVPFTSIFFLVTSIVGAVLGKMEMNAINEGRAPQAGETMAKVGFYLGIASAALSFLFFALGVLGIVSSIMSRP